MVGYDHVLSIEHEDSLMSGPEGLRKAIAFLKDVVIAEPAGGGRNARLGHRGAPGGAKSGSVSFDSSTHKP